MNSPIDRRQLAFDVTATRPRFSRADYEVRQSNRAAATTVDAFVDSVEPALAICGPKGAGKTHLTHILAVENGACIYDAQNLDAAIADQRALTIVDNLETSLNPRRLLAFIEDRRASGVKIVLAGRGRPADWSNGLKDLATRLEAMTRASLEEPDEALMRAVIAHRFRERQWRVGRGVAAYAAPRLPRTFAAAEAFVDAASAAVAAGERLNLALTRKVIDNLYDRPGED